MNAPDRVVVVPGPPDRSAPAAKGLRRGVLGLVAGMVIGIASTAPAYSLAASLGLVVVLVGDKAPAALLIAFVPMYCIAVAYRELNRIEPDCGTTFTWVARAFGPWTGWMGGWGLVSSAVVVMANLAQISGEYTFLLIGAPDLADSTLWTTVVGVAWIAAMTWICYRGIGLAVRVQFVLLGIELVLLGTFALVALVQVYGGIAPDGSAIPSWSWLWPSGLELGDLTDAVIIAVFLYWGWDSAVSCNEESTDPTRTPGWAGVLSTLVLLVTYVAGAVAAVAFAGIGDEGVGLGNEANSSDMFAALGPAVFGDSATGRFLTTLLILCVLTSAAASTQTTILPTARAALSMGAYRAIPPRFATIHPRYRTPGFATWAMGIVSAVFYVGLTLISENVLADSIAAVGLLIAFYYGITGFACAWLFRRRRAGRNRWVTVVVPGFGGLMLLAAFVLSAADYADPESSDTNVFGIGGAFVIGIGALLAGAVLMVLYARTHPSYFRGDTLAPTPEAELDGRREPATTADSWG